MARQTRKYTSVDDYVADFPKSTQSVLKCIRKEIVAAVPDAEEAISYNIPTIRMGKRYVLYFAAYPKHVGIYPVHRDGSELAKETAPYRSGKATLRFPLDAPIPYRLIRKIAEYKVAQMGDA
jgi:uncharacterized protein YdhG (YjbR/CyaY superfamily)